MTKKELFKTELNRIRKKIAKYNQELADYVKMTESDEVPDIDCSIIGISPMCQIEIRETENGIQYNDDGMWNDIDVVDEFGEYWLVGEDELNDLLKYNRRRLKKGIRVWKSENPDKELEKDDDDE